MSKKVKRNAFHLYLDVEDATISNWNSNKMQPGLKRIEEIGDLLEVDNIELIASKYRKPTGLAGKLQLEYKRLLSEGNADKSGHFRCKRQSKGG